MVNNRLMEIEAELIKDPDNPKIWLEKGLELVNLYMHYEAIEAFSIGLTLDSTNPELLLARGRRYISIRRYNEALADLSLASRLQPESFDNWYYMGVAYTISGNFTKATKAFEACLNFVLRNDDETLRAPVVDWLWLLYMRLGQKDDAEHVLSYVAEDAPVLTMAPSYKKIALLYKGLLLPDSFIDENQLASDDERALLYYITEVYCLSNYYYLMGNSEASNALLLRLKQVDQHHYAFAYQMAERDMRLRGL